MQSLRSSPAEIGLQAPPVRDRRRRARHKVQLPAYASLSKSASAPALELSEIVDISEDGMAIQTSSPLEVGQREAFFLDLPETHAVIPTEGKVIWTEPSGRAGVQFPEMQPELILALKKWLFANAVAACVNHAAETADASREHVFESQSAEDFQAPAQPDYTAMLAALAAVKREVEGLGNDLDAALHLIARRAQAFTRATGAAIALTEGGDMVCRANAGRDAPPCGAHLRIGSGFSGECVRTGTLLRCDDSESDPRVDREGCRALGIRSMLGAPIRSDGSIIGLLEVFSPEVEGFGPEDELVLLQLVEVVSGAVRRADSPQGDSGVKSSVDDEFLVEDAADLPLQGRSRSRNGVLIAAAITIVFVILWLIGTWDGNSRRRPTVTPSAEQPKAVPRLPAAAPAGTGDLQALAEQGDPAAQFATGARYATGEGVSQDYTEAVRWFTKAAEQGHVAAQATLGAYYWAGRGVPADLSKAYFWSLLAEA
ncbi:MAG TPA: GAF domain-containing protein, partial [Terriglobales bacterium]|nr:GAF domain-containing protein [Terriglobales bacterium]